MALSEKDLERIWEKRAGTQIPKQIASEIAERTGQLKSTYLDLAEIGVKSGVMEADEPQEFGAQLEPLFDQLSKLCYYIGLEYKAKAEEREKGGNGSVVVQDEVVELLQIATDPSLEIARQLIQRCIQSEGLDAQKGERVAGEIGEQVLAISAYCFSAGYSSES